MEENRNSGRSNKVRRVGRRIKRRNRNWVLKNRYSWKKKEGRRWERRKDRKNKRRKCENRKKKRENGIKWVWRERFNMNYNGGRKEDCRYKENNRENYEYRRKIK